MATRSAKLRGSVNQSKIFKTAPIKVKEEWRVLLREHRILYGNHACDVLLLVEDSYNLSSAIDDIEEQAEESTVVKFIRPESLIKFLHTTFNSRPEYDYFTFFEEAFTELYDEYYNTNKLSSESYVYLIKLRILAYNEIIAHDRALIKDLKTSLETEMKTMQEQQNSSRGAKRLERKSRTVSLKHNTLDRKYLQAKQGIIPNFTDIRKIPTIYNTDYDEPIPENIYYILCGIYDPCLIQHLQKLNITILALIQLGVEGVSFNTEEMVIDNFDEDEFDRMLSMRGFWRNLMQDKTDIPKISKNSCYVKYSIPEPSSQKPSFDNFMILLKNISDFKRLYYHYFANVRHLDVEETSRPVNLSSMNNYFGFLDQIPNECITIPLMLHALIDEVCVRVDNWTNEKLEHLDKIKRVKKKYHGGPVVQIRSLLREYDCSHKKAPPIVKMPKPVSVSYGNTLEYINAHVPINKHINTIEITLHELKKTLPLKLFEKIDARNTFDLMFYNYVFSKWRDQLTNVSVEELTLCVYAYLFTRGNFRKFSIPTVPSECTKLNRIQECMFGVTKLYNETHQVLNIKLNTSFLRTHLSLQTDHMQSLSNAQNELGEDNINESCDNLSQQYHTLAQELDAATFIQMINVAYTNYNHFDYKYFAPTDVILLRFHNRDHKQAFNKKHTKYFLRTPLCFRDFCYKQLLQDSDWFLREEREHWKKVYIQREKEKEYLTQHPKVDDSFDPKDFIIQDSIKYNLSKARGSIKRSAIKNDNRRKSNLHEDKLNLQRRSVKKSRESLFISSASRIKIKQSVSVPTFETYIKSKNYDFEIYNLGQHFYPLEFDEIYYHSTLSVKFTKEQLPRQPLRCTFVVSSLDNSLIFHCEQDGIFKATKPFYFHINMTNGIVMVFSTPMPPLPPRDSRHVVMHKRRSTNYEYRNSNYKNDSVQSSINKLSKSKSTTTDEIDPKVTELRNEVLQYLTIAMKEQLPVFKIISSRLHKYQYVKRIKSRIVLPIGTLYRRVCCKPILYKRFPKNHNIYEAKCIPYSDLAYKDRTPLIWKWNSSLPSGLSMETVQANVPNDFYIRQRYVIERTDLPSIQDEAYRCYLRCGIIMKFLKDGSIKTLSPDKSLSHYKYGYFSSNKQRVSKDNFMKDIRLKKQTNVIPLHAYKKNISALEKQVRKISKKYKRHLIDIADNYRFESSREESRKMHKIYKLSKKIYTRDSHIIPLINHTVVTSEGRYIDVKNNIVQDTYKKFEETRNRDYLLNETVTRREDGTAWMIDSNGNAITQFPDGSRITTWYTILDENLVLGQDIIDYQKRVINMVEEPESLTKFCQTVDDEYEENEEEDVEILYNKETSTKDFSTSSTFVLVGMNYSFEHPNYATVSYYCWEETSADILLPDKIKVTAHAEGTYKLKLINNDTININAEDVEFFVHNTDLMKRESCHISLGTFNVDKPKPERPFLSLKEQGENVFIITCDGQTENRPNYSPNTSTIEADSNISSDRTFVMRRDLSGMEMLKEPIPYNFIHTLIDLKDSMSSKSRDNIIKGPTKLKIYKQLKKTYSEHLMMMYEVPILATTKERQCLDKLWKLHDLDINTIIAKRSPLIVYERYISILPGEIIMKELAQAVLKCIIEGNENLPNVNMILEMVESAESEQINKPEVIEVKTPEKKRAPRNMTCRKQMEKFKQLTKNNGIPQYFETLRGLMFLAVEECSEGAMDESSARHRDPATITISTKRTMKSDIKSRISQLMRSTARKTEVQRMQDYKDKADKERVSAIRKESVISDKPATSKSIMKENQDSFISNTITTKFNVPEHMHIHLKTSAPVHEIVLTSTGLQIVTDKNADSYYYSSHNLTDTIQAQRSVTGKIDAADKTEKTDKDRTDHQMPNIESELMNTSSGNMPKYNSSFFMGEDVAGYFGSSIKMPSWDDTLCQKVCQDSLTTTTTLVTTPKLRPQIVGCMQDACKCSQETIQRLAKCCQCGKYYCNCKDTYSAFATCAVQNELNISEAVCVLATKIIQTIEKDSTKFNLLNTKLDSIIRETANTWGILEPTSSDLIRALRWIIDNKVKVKNTIPEETAQTIIKQLEATVSKIKIAKDTITLTIGNLQKMADLVVKLICNSKNNPNIAKEIRNILRDANISRLDIIDTLKLAKEKMHLYYEHGLYPADLPLPEIPAESKCCKITQYIDYQLDLILEGNCEKCNSRSIITNSSVHNTSPVNFRSKDSFQKSCNLTLGSLNKSQKSKTPTNSKELITLMQELDKVNEQHDEQINTPANQIIVEPFYSDLPEKEQKSNTVNEAEYDVSSVGGYSLVKSCQEIVDVSVPFMSKNIVSEEAPLEAIFESQIRDKKASTHGAEVTDKLSKTDLTTSSSKSKDKDIITILAPEQHAEIIPIEEQSKTLLSPLLMRTAQKQRYVGDKKPIVYDGNIVTKI